MNENDRACTGHRKGTAFAVAALLVLAGCDAVPASAPAGARGALSTSDAGTTELVEVETVLLPSDVSQASKFGLTLALSGDVLVTSAPSWNVGGAQSEGGVYVFVRDPATGQWLEQKKIIPRNSALEWSFNVAIDGDTIAVGVPYTSTGQGFQRGAVYLYERDQGGTDNWGEVIKLSGSSLGDLAQFGSSLALSGDLLVVGAPEPSSIGQVVFFERNRGGANAWGSTSTLSYNDDGGLGPEYFGISLALDGDLLLVGATSADVSDYASNDGAAYLFQRDAVDRDRWDYVTRFTEAAATRCTEGRTISEMWSESQEVQDAWALCADADTSTDNIGFGGNVELGDGVALITSRGAVNVFERDLHDAGLWPQVATLENNDGTGFARLALEGDTLLVGASGTDVDGKVDQGAVHVFERDASSGTFVGVETLIANDGLTDDHFGNALALQGATRVIGAYARNGLRGALYVHEAQDVQTPLPPQCDPLNPSTDTLLDAGSVTHASGFMIAAPAGALLAPLPIWIEAVPAPAAPLPSGAVAHGDYYSVGADCTTFTAPGRQLTLSIPVPEGVDTAHLGAALLVPPSSVLDRAPSAEAFWQTLAGRYDAASHTLVVALGALSSDGNTLVLIEHAELESAPLAPDAPNARRPASVFDVQCGLLIAPTICTPQARTTVELAMLEAYATFQQQAFPEPYLSDKYGSIGTRPYRVEIRDGSTNPSDLCYGGVTAAYDIARATIMFCVPPGGVPGWSTLRGSARHELFHAVQFAYPSVRNGARNHWVMEGTADAAVSWNGAMHRKATRLLRRADISLTEGDAQATRAHAYRAQDFWVHLFVATGSDGVRRNHPLSRLQSFFEVGASTAAIAARLHDGIVAPVFDELGDEYWAWAKNQVMEKTDVTFDGALVSPCALEYGLLGQSARVDYVGPGADDFEPFRVDGRFDEGLVTQVVEITFREETEGVTVTAYGGDDLAYKVYLQGESDCIGPPDSDGPRTFDQPLPAGAVVLMVLANKRIEAGTLAYEVEVEVAQP